MLNDLLHKSAKIFYSREKRKSFQIFPFHNKCIEQLKEFHFLFYFTNTRTRLSYLILNKKFFKRRRKEWSIGLIVETICGIFREQFSNLKL